MLSPEREQEIRAAAENDYPFDDGSQGQAGEDVKVLLVEIDRLREENADLNDTVWEQTDKALKLFDQCEPLRLENETLRYHVAKAREALRFCVDNIQGCLDGTDLPSMAIRDNARAVLGELSDD